MKKKIVAIIPARAGSVRLKNKNILKFKNKPLIAWSIEAALKSKLVDKIIVSSNSIKIEQICKQYDKIIFSKRPKFLSTSNSSINETILHEINKHNLIDFNYLILLQPTSPLRSYKDINRSLTNIIKKKKEVSISFYKNIKNLTKNLYILDKNLNLKKTTEYKKEKIIKNFYIPSGDIYISTIKSFLLKKTFFRKKILPYFISYYSDIDTLDDFRIAEKKYKSINR